MTEIIIHYVDDINLYVECDQDVASGLAEHFSFRIPNYYFHPKVQAGIWDGVIRLFNAYSKTILSGLETQLLKYCEDNNYNVSFANKKIHNVIFDCEQFIENLNLPYAPRYYQKTGLISAIENNRRTFLSPTNSGKSLIMYMICRWYLDHCLSEDERILIIVPTVQLVTQLNKNFEEYGYDGWDNNIHKISGGESKDPANKQIIISTWQSIYKQPKKYFSDLKIRAVIGDEVHRFSAVSLNGIMLKLPNCPYRFGLTGTLQETKSDILSITGLFGEVERLITNNEMIENGWSADITIKAIVLKYSEEERKAIVKTTYIKEVDYIIQHKKRMKFICKLANSLSGNTLILYRFVKKHGRPLYDSLTASRDNVHFISGSVDTEVREQIRTILNSENNAIVVASLGTTAVGIDAKYINNIITVTPNKSKITVLQLIGRGLRTASSKSKMTLYDIVDDFSWKKKQNYSLKHFINRVEYYNNEQFNYNLINVEI